MLVFNLLGPLAVRLFGLRRGDSDLRDLSWYLCDKAVSYTKGSTDVEFR